MPKQSRLLASLMDFNGKGGTELEQVVGKRKRRRTDVYADEIQRALELSMNTAVSFFFSTLVLFVCPGDVQLKPSFPVNAAHYTIW
jgi:hypothetical protein